MKIVAKKMNRDAQVVGIIVEMTPDELALLSKGERAGYNEYNYGNLRDGADIDICDRFKSVMAIEHSVHKSANVGDSLRAMAAAVDAVVKSASEAILPPKVPEQAE